MIICTRCLTTTGPFSRACCCRSCSANYIAPPNHLLISKVFYLGSTSVVTGSEWVQIYNPTPITVSLSGYKLGDQAVPGPTGFTVDGMWQFPPTASIAPGGVINVATTAHGFFNKYGRYPALRVLRQRRRAR